MLKVHIDYFNFSVFFFNRPGPKSNYKSRQGSSINDVTTLGREGGRVPGLWDDSSKKRDDGRCPKLRDHTFDQNTLKIHFADFLTIKMKMKHYCVWKVQNVSQQLWRLFLSAIDHSTTELPFKSVASCNLQRGCKTKDRWNQRPYF